MAISEGGSVASDAGFSSRTLGLKKSVETIDFLDAIAQGGPKPGQVVVIRIPKEVWEKTAAKMAHINGCVYQPPEED